MVLSRAKDYEMSTESLGYGTLSIGDKKLRALGIPKVSHALSTTQQVLGEKKLSIILVNLEGW